MFTYTGNMRYEKLVLNFYEKHKRMPSLRELAVLCGFQSTNAASKLVDRLTARRVVEKDATGKIIPGRTIREIPVLGLIEAGFPVHTEETLHDSMNIDEYLIDNREASFVLRVKGDSMVDAGICSGDLVVVERGAQPHVGDIVIAEIDGEYTMKYYHMRRGKAFLMPANKKYKPFFPKDSLTIVAVVRAVIRKY